MSRFIPNENTWVGFALAVASPLLNPTKAEVDGAVNLTPFLMSLNASSTGNTVPTPSIATLFETSVPGTVQASFTADFYRDDDNDLAWLTLPRRTEGFFLVSRFGGSDPTNAPKPTTADTVEVWPIQVVSRTASNIANNTVSTFTLTCSVPIEPNEEGMIGS